MINLVREEIKALLKAAQRDESLDAATVVTTCENALKDLESANSRLSDAMSLVDCAQKELCEAYVWFNGCRDTDNIPRAERRRLVRRALAGAMNNLSCATCDGEKVAHSLREPPDAQ